MVITGGDDARTTGAELRIHDSFRVTPECEDLNPSLGVPDPGGAVHARGDDLRTVGAERRRMDIVGVALERENPAPVGALKTLAESTPVVTKRVPSGLNVEEMTPDPLVLSVYTSAADSASRTTIDVVRSSQVRRRKPAGTNHE